MQKTLFPALTALLVLSACSANQGDVVIDDASSSSSIVEDVTNDASSSVEAMDDASSDDAASARVIEMTVDNWAFSPAAITASMGEKVTPRVTGGEGIHSFAIPELNLNVRVEPGQTVNIELPTGTAGTFAFMCRIPCGEGHKDMKGTFTVS